MGVDPRRAGAGAQPCWHISVWASAMMVLNGSAAARVAWLCSVVVSAMWFPDGAPD